MPMIPGEKVILRPLDHSHAEKTRQWVNDAELARLLGRARPVSDREHEEWLTAVGKREDCVFFAICEREGGRHIGNVWLWNIEPRHQKAELRIVIGEAGHAG